ncbi:uncharacterized protein TNCV_898561 [Trichonephila clavipes]|nr:uncharacterized protein TNCV_898561 [Trichonephila clavipes]
MEFIYVTTIENYLLNDTLQLLKLIIDCYRVHYFVRGGFVRHRSRASSKHLSLHLPVDGARFLGGQKGVVLHLQDARVGVGSTKKPTPLDVDVRKSDVTTSILYVALVVLPVGTETRSGMGRLFQGPGYF